MTDLGDARRAVRSVGAPPGRCATLKGSVTSVDHLASSVGVALLRAGGSAVDAAIGINAVLAVTAQHLCGVGGDLLAVVVAPGAEPLALQAIGRAGSGADPDRLRAEGRTGMPLRGDIRSVTVPGCVDGWMALHERFGRLPLRVVLAPAMDYASSGFAASPSLARATGALVGLAETDGLHPGLLAAQAVRRPRLAQTLEAIATNGREGFYGGRFGEELLALGPDEFVADDLEQSLASWSAAIGQDVWGHRLWTVGPPSQGYLTLAAAAIAQGLDLPTDPTDPLWAHLLIEASRQAAWDRHEVLADGADAQTLLDARRLALRTAAVSNSGASTLGDTFVDGDTTAICVVDDERLGVALVQSNAAGFGSHLVLPGAGVFLHNRASGLISSVGARMSTDPGGAPYTLFVRPPSPDAMAASPPSPARWGATPSRRYSFKYWRVGCCGGRTRRTRSRPVAGCSGLRGEAPGSTPGRAGAPFRFSSRDTLPHDGRRDWPNSDTG